MFGMSSEPAASNSSATRPRLGQLPSVDFRSTGEPGGLAQNYPEPLTGKLGQADRSESEGGRSDQSLPIDSELLNQIKDNASFRPQERAAWFALFGRLEALSNAALHASSIGQLSYAQLVSQPDAYRGRMVTIRGTAIRAEVEHPTDNPLGLAEYYRLWLQPAGGGEWPFVVYALQLPDRFPRGDRLRLPVAVTGYFFKNWSYSWGDGLGLAPIILAAGVDWTPPIATRQPVPQVGWSRLALAVAATIGVALLVLLLAWRQTARRPLPASSRHDGNAEGAIGEGLRQLVRPDPSKPEGQADGNEQERQQA
jgi:hypothetical protein